MQSSVDVFAWNKMSNKCSWVCFIQATNSALQRLWHLNTLIQWLHCNPLDARVLLYPVGGDPAVHGGIIRATINIHPRKHTDLNHISITEAVQWAARITLVKREVTIKDTTSGLFHKCFLRSYKQICFKIVLLLLSSYLYNKAKLCTSHLLNDLITINHVRGSQRNLLALYFPVNLYCANLVVTVPTTMDINLFVLMISIQYKISGSTQKCHVRR